MTRRTTAEVQTDQDAAHWRALLNLLRNSGIANADDLCAVDIAEAAHARLKEPHALWMKVEERGPAAFVTELPY